MVETKTIEPQWREKTLARPDVLAKELAERCYLTSKHFSAGRTETLSKAATEIAKCSEDPRIWSYERALLFFAFIDTSLLRQEPDRMLSPLFQEINLKRVPPEIYIGHTSVEELSDEDITEAVIDMQKQEEMPDPREYISDELTDYLRLYYFNRWDDSSNLHNVRRTFKITPQTEKQFDLTVTDLSTHEFSKMYDCLAYVSGPSNNRTIVLPRDATENTRIHEYIHTQWRLFSGSHSALYRGLEEAFVEANTPVPEVYEAQIQVLKLFLRYIPDMHYLVKQSGKPNQRKDEMLTHVVNAFGLQGVSILSRYSPMSDFESGNIYSEDQKRVFLPVREARQMLESATIAS